MWGLRPHLLIDVTVAAGCLLVARHFWAKVAAWPDSRRRTVRFLVAATVLIVWLGILLGIVPISRQLPVRPVTWTRCIGLFAGGYLLWTALALALLRSAGAFRPDRRALLSAGVTAAVAAPTAVASFGILTRDDLEVREVEVRIPDWARDLNGIRLVQVSDIHLSPFVSESYLARAIDAANSAKAHLAVVTGDLISYKGDPLDACLRQLARLRADAGVYGCMGNHEIYSEAESEIDRVAPQFGIRFLRSQSVQLRFGGSTLSLAGVDYQRRTEPYLEGAEELLVPGSYNLLLSHNPDVFPVAVSQGYDLTLAGHTHGGQVTLEMIHPALNPVRFMTHYVHGLYSKEGRSIYVTRGIGTIGVPVRLGARPEIAIIRLCAT